MALLNEPPRARLASRPRQPRSKQMQFRSPIITQKRNTSSQNRDPEESISHRQTRLPLHLGLCNTLLGAVGFISAISFGVVTIVQSSSANREAKIANKLAKKSLMLSWVQTCAQVADIRNSTMCAAMQELVQEIFWPQDRAFGWEWGTNGFGGNNQTAGNRGLFAIPLGFLDGFHSDSMDILRIPQRIYALYWLALVLCFLLSGLMLRMTQGWDFISATMNRRELGRAGYWETMECCLLEVYYLVWLEAMIGFMLQDLGYEY